jgi:carbonic anhydrase
VKNFKTTQFIFVAIILFYSCAPKKTENTNSTRDKVKKEEPVKQSARPAHWGYDGNDGPSYWASLDPVYSKCGDGLHQSPINISKTDVKGGAT